VNTYDVKLMTTTTTNGLLDHGAPLRVARGVVQLEHGVH